MSTSTRIANVTLIMMDDDYGPFISAYANLFIIQSERLNTRWLVVELRQHPPAGCFPFPTMTFDATCPKALVHELPPMFDFKYCQKRLSCQWSTRCNTSRRFAMVFFDEEDYLELKITMANAQRLEISNGSARGFNLTHTAVMMDEQPLTRALPAVEEDAESEDVDSDDDEDYEDIGDDEDELVEDSD